ncbi:formylmethanofuran--tetrahydromethanopterin N-formyltransferase [Mariniblastus fucicola]|uniref:Formyltransferase/hydrolase complex subunit D n=1 Tax=Mariniblastus fucicola TaxID=980251 RepID=A0A5B9PH53_9BACT|nr:formylmethanofuran--tetrahydromethanopterin N-formyltransferase [Mariniblastus fucicola]QEG22181.1 Formyltransferase/hydrolase complex subunit D [Mariniblastus fucicola]
MKIGNTIIEDTFAEGFGIRYTRLIVTAHDAWWLGAGLTEFCGYGSSVILCDAEVGIEVPKIANSIDGRAAASVLAFGFSADGLAKAISKRTGQCLMTCATTAVFDGMKIPGDSPFEVMPSDAEDAKPIPLGDHIRYFGDGFQKSKIIGDRRLWRIPVMEGEFIVEDATTCRKGVAGGNFLIQSTNLTSGLDAARRAVEAIKPLPNVITPFPGGVVRSGSKVGSRYEALVASTSHTFCPTLRGRVESKVHPDANCVLEIVINGVDFDSVKSALKSGIHAAIDPKFAGDSIVAISAGNYGGDLGKHHFQLHDVMQDSAAETESTADAETEAGS